MKFTCQKSDLTSVLPNVAKATSLKTPLEALGSILLDAKGTLLTLTGYDLDLGIRTEIPAVIAEEGTLLVDSRLFVEIVRRMPETIIHIETDEHRKVTISGGDSTCQLAGMPANEYPDLPEIEQEHGAVIPQSLLRNMIEQTIYAVSIDETKPVFTGELFEIENGHFTMVALDNYRMAMRSEPLPEQDEMKFVVPAKSLREIEHLLVEDSDNQHPCVIRLGQNHAIFECDKYWVYTRLLAGEFVSYRRSIPTGEKTQVMLSRRELMDCLERCALLINEQNKTPVRFQLESDKLYINCQNVIGSVEDQVVYQMTGDKMVIGFNNRYLLDAVRSMQGDRVRMYLIGPERAVRIMEAEGEGSVSVIMPVQVRK